MAASQAACCCCLELLYAPVSLAQGMQATAACLYAGFDNEGPLPAETLPKAPPREVKLVTRKPLMAAPEEQAANPRSRSAKLRVAEKLGAHC